MSMLAAVKEHDWIKLDLHIHTLDDPKDSLDYSAHQLLERAKARDFSVLAITLHDQVFDRREVFEDAASMGIMMISAAEMRLSGADIVVLNVSKEEGESLRTFDDVRRLRDKRGNSIFTFAPHPFYVLGGSIGPGLLTRNIDCFDAIEWCHFYRGWFNPNKPAERVARKHGKPMLATSDAHLLDAFGSHYTSIPRPAELTPENVFDSLRSHQLRLTAPPCSYSEMFREVWFMFVDHPIRKRLRANEPARHHLAQAGVS